MGEPLLELEDVTIQYTVGDANLTAVSNANMAVEEGEFFGLAGESGSGKSTLARAILGALDDNGVVASGSIKYQGEDIQEYSEKQLNDRIRWKEISWVPQSSMNSLDPLQKVSEKAVKIARVHTDLSDEEALDRLRDMFDIVGIQESRIDDYPDQFSGGMRQRAIIALALFLQPKLVIADEPTTALDVIMQDQIFKYLDQMKSQLETSLLLITHDISVIFQSCDKIAIMHGSQIAETGPVREVYQNPRHPYAFMFKDAFPDVRMPNKDLTVIKGYPPELYGNVNHCSFVERCPWAVEECSQYAPTLEPVDGSTDHTAACFRKEDAYESYQSMDYQDYQVDQSPTDTETTD